jgi:hypothetical protein
MSIFQSRAAESPDAEDENHMFLCTVGCFAQILFRDY